MEELEQLKQEVKELQDWKKSLERDSTIPINIDQSFRARFAGDDLILSTKSSSSENQAVDEGGAATYNVLKSPDGFLEIEISGTIYYLPYFT